MISSGNSQFDSLLDGGYREEVTLLYGPAASGKTTLCFVLACDMLKRDKKVVYLDTENGFSIERFMQICGPGYLTMLDRLLLLKAASFPDQCKKIDSLMKLVHIDLIIVDSLGIHYRHVLQDNPTETNKQMDRQLRILTEISRRGVPIFVTTQVSTNPETGEVHMVGGEMVKSWGKSIIELRKDPRKIMLKRPEERSTSFEIIDRGISILSF